MPEYDQITYEIARALYDSQGPGSNFDAVVNKGDWLRRAQKMKRIMQRNGVTIQ